MSLTRSGVRLSMTGETVVGVVTDSAGFVGNTSDSSNSVLVGLVGQMDVFVSNLNGPIYSGDKVGTSSIQGHGAKYTDGTTVVGFALEDMVLGETDFSNALCPSEYRNERNINGGLIECGKLHLLLRPM